MKILPKGLVLDGIPTHSYPQPQPTAGQEIDVSRLPRHQCGLALGKDQDPGHKSDSFGDTGQVAEHHEWVVKRIVLVIGAHQRGRPIGMNGPEYVLIGEKMVEAQVFHCSAESPDRSGISPRLVLREGDTNLH